MKEKEFNEWLYEKILFAICINDFTDAGQRAYDEYMKKIEKAIKQHKKGLDINIDGF